MAERVGLDAADLPGIEHELARAGLRFCFRVEALERRYQDRQAEATRLLNRVTIVMLIGLYDAFLVPEMSASPEVVRLSACLRLGLLTPAALAFLWADRARLLKGCSGWMVAALLLAPTMLSAIESQWTRSPAAMSYFQAMPLIQLVVLTCRVGLPQVAAIGVLSCALFAFVMLTACFVPPGVAPSLILEDVAIAIGTLVFTWRIETRDRQVFLFGLQADIRRELLAVQNCMLARLSQVDALTGLGNRRCFDDALASLWSDIRMLHASVTLVIFDIDCFKLFNDTYGHQAGDECLTAVARAISPCLRNDRDTLVRYGGEEFAIILPETLPAEGQAVAERVRQAVCDRAIPHPHAGPRPTVTVSVGVATVIPAQQSAAVLIEAADQCLYAAKRAGRNQVVAHLSRASFAVPALLMAADGRAPWPPFPVMSQTDAT